MTQITRSEPAGLVRPAQRDSLVDVLDRVLDKGVVIAGDIRINLLDIELLTVKIRLLIASVDKAREMGIDWWAHDPQLSSRGKTKRLEQKSDSPALEKENQELRRRVEMLESKLNAVLDQPKSVAAKGARAGASRGR
ncbi:MAG TPA: gas vesicle protein [Tepidisphaeraceae bacterium]|nr:gas vesicle protein [Tepidisphaeraceae bacterium]